VDVTAPAACPAHADERDRCVRRSRVVLTPRCWRPAQRVDALSHTGAREPVPGESTKDTVKPIAQGMPDVWLNLWYLPPAFFSAGGPWARPSPGIPCALFISEGRLRSSLGRYASRERGGMPRRDRPEVAAIPSSCPRRRVSSTPRLFDSSIAAPGILVARPIQTATMTSGTLTCCADSAHQSSFAFTNSVRTALVAWMAMMASSAAASSVAIA